MPKHGSPLSEAPHKKGSDLKRKRGKEMVKKITLLGPGAGLFDQELVIAF